MMSQPPKRRNNINQTMSTGIFIGSERQVFLLIEDKTHIFDKKWSTLNHVWCLIRALSNFIILVIWAIFTSVKGDYVFGNLGLFVCLFDLFVFPRDYLQSNERNYMKLRCSLCLRTIDYICAGGSGLWSRFVFLLVYLSVRMSTYKIKNEFEWNFYQRCPRTINYFLEMIRITMQNPEYGPDLESGVRSRCTSEVCSLWLIV